METHTPVLLRESVASLDIQEGDTVLDATLGTGGHARVMLAAMKRGIFVGIDADADALRQAERNLAPMPETITIHLKESNFRNIAAVCADLDIRTCDRVLADLGWGSHHLTSGRGFSFSRDEPLNMCYGTKKDACVFTAHDAVNTFEERHLTDIIRGYGEERWAKRIAEHIVSAREQGAITSTQQLAGIVSGAIPRKCHPKNIHAATRTFQAIRIAVNDELQALKDFLDVILPLMHPKSRLAVISFHSLEDRIVKQTFRGWEQEALGERYTKKAIQPSEEEHLANPRARSAKLRTFIFH